MLEPDPNHVDQSYGGPASQALLAWPSASMHVHAVAGRCCAGRWRTWHDMAGVQGERTESKEEETKKGGRDSNKNIKLETARSRNPKYDAPYATACFVFILDQRPSSIRVS